MLNELFKEIQINNKFFSSCEDGDEFEQSFINKLKAYNFSRISQKTNINSKINKAISRISELEKIKISECEKKWKDIKKKILMKNSIEIVTNPFSKIENSFIFQPYGSQQFPDFIIFTCKYIIPIEIKYSKKTKSNNNLHNSKPMWNSNMPKPNSIYLYGVAGEKTTFFNGNDILNIDTRQVLLDFFINLDKKKENLNNQLKNLKNNFGIYPYIRKAYEHNLKSSTYFDSNKKKTIESYFSENKNKREKNVISFLDKINDEENN